MGPVLIGAAEPCGMVMRSCSDRRLFLLGLRRLPLRKAKQSALAMFIS